MAIVLNRPKKNGRRAANPRTSIASRPQLRLHNPSAGSLLLGVVVAGAAVAGGVAIYKHIHDPMKGGGNPNNQDPDAVLKDFVKVGATLGESDYVVTDIKQPVYLSTSGTGTQYPKVSEIAVLTNTTIQPLDEVIFGMDPANLSTVQKENAWYGWLNGKPMTGTKSPKAVALLITNVTGEFARFAYEYALSRIAQNPQAWDAGNRDTTIAGILAQIAPKLDWSKGLSPYTFGDAAYYAWVAVETIGTVAQQSLQNKQLA